METKRTLQRAIAMAEKVGLVLTVNDDQTRYRFTRPDKETGINVSTLDEALAIIRGYALAQLP